METKAFLLDAENNKYEVVTLVENAWQELARYCDCKYTEKSDRFIGGKPFTIICDEDGLFKENPTPSAISVKNEVAFVGKLLIFDYSDGLEFESISDHNVEFLKSQISNINYKGRKLTVLTNIG